MPPTTEDDILRALITALTPPGAINAALAAQVSAAAKDLLAESESRTQVSRKPAPAHGIAPTEKKRRRATAPTAA